MELGLFFSVTVIVFFHPAQFSKVYLFRIGKKKKSIYIYIYDRLQLFVYKGNLKPYFIYQYIVEVNINFM